MSKSIKYNKLVRDLIPDIIKKSNKKAVTHIADDTEYVTHLYRKVHEELDEFIEHPCVEEMGDLIEVLEAISTYFDLDQEEIERVRLEKKNKRGSFTNKIILDEVIEE